MAYKINDACVSCGACAETCPVGAISEGDGKYVISEDCVECGACAAGCPMGAIEAP
ncbi:MAG: 4Fe-4S binding protein [Selenomonadales bacterium]|nr:4Fe-4S binding protein [Selenomonadales bacterium]